MYSNIFTYYQTYSINHKWVSQNATKSTSLQIPSNKHPRQKQSPNHQRHPAHRRTPHCPRILLRFCSVYNHLSIQAVHDFLRLSRRSRITDSRTRIRILINPYPIRTARLQNSLHISVWAFCLVQRDLIIIFDIGGHGGGHGIARVVALGWLCELCAVGIARNGRCHGDFVFSGVVRSGLFRDATRNRILAVI